MGCRPCRGSRRIISDLLGNVDGEGHVLPASLDANRAGPERPTLTCMFVAPGVGLEPTTCGLTIQDFCPGSPYTRFECVLSGARVRSVHRLRSGPLSLCPVVSGQTSSVFVTQFVPLLLLISL